MSSTLNNKSPAVNMSDIARVAKVSRPTVSIVLNGRHSSARISNETRGLVLQVARDLGYRRNALAHAVKTGCSFTLGFLTTCADNEYSMLTLSGILSEAEVPESDALALIIMLKMHRMGLRLPRDVSVIGCGDMVRVGSSYPPSTTIKVPYRDLGRASVSKLLELLKNPQVASRGEEISFETPLIVRESTTTAKSRL